VDQQTKKKLQVGFVVACLLLAGVIFSSSFLGGTGKSGNTGDGMIPLMCVSCGGFEVSIDEFRQMFSQDSTDSMSMMSGPPAVMQCPKCDKKSCYEAMKCKKCQNIFVYGQSKDRKLPDRCPKCGFSEIEDSFKNQTR